MVIKVNFHCELMFTHEMRSVYIMKCSREAWGFFCTSDEPVKLRVAESLLATILVCNTFTFSFVTADR